MTNSPLKLGPFVELVNMTNDFEIESTCLEIVWWHPYPSLIKKISLIKNHFQKKKKIPVGFADPLLSFSLSLLLERSRTNTDSDDQGKMAAADTWQPQEQGLREIRLLLEQQITPGSDQARIWQQLQHFSQFPDFNNYLVFILARAQVLSSTIS
jgi:hypothetical protein